MENDIGTSSWWVGNFYDSLVRWCVPVFVMISGSLLLDPCKNESLSIFYTKRMSKILIPLMFWAVFFLVWPHLKGAGDDQELSVLGLIKTLASGKPHFHLWFLYMIISLYIFTPFFRKIISSSTRYEIIIFVTITLFFSALSAVMDKVLPSGNSLFIYWFLSYVPYFFLGHLIREDKNNYSTTFLWMVFLVSSVLTAIGCYFIGIRQGLNSGLYFYSYVSITVIPMSISILYLLKSWNKPIISRKVTKTLAALTLGVYLIHPIFLEILSLYGYSATKYNPLWSVPAITVLVSVLSLCLTYLISKINYLNRII